MTWQWMQLGELLVTQGNRKKVQQGWSPQCLGTPAPDGKWGVLKTTAIQAGRFEPQHNKELPAHLEPRPQIEIKAGDLLLTCAGPRARCGVPALVRSTPTRLMMSGKMYRIRPDERLDSRFLELWLLSPTAQRQIDAMKTGISDSGLNLTHARFTQLPVPVPSIDVQRRLIDLIEDQFSRLNVADAGLEASSRRLNVWYRRISESLIWDATYQQQEVGRLLREPMRNGRSDRAAKGNEEGIRTLTLTAVTKNSFTETNSKKTVTTAERAAGLWLEPGDIFVQRANTPELVGTAARYEGPSGWAIYPDLLIRLRADEAVVDGRFLVAALRTDHGHNQLRSKAKGLAGTMPKIDQAAVASVRIPVPALARQHDIIRRLSTVEAVYLRQKEAINVARRRSAALRRAVLIEAFRGRLG